MHAHVIGAEVASIAVGSTPEGLLSFAQQRDARANSVAIVLDAFQSNRKPVSAWPALIHQKSCRTVVIGDQNVDISVVIHVTERSAPADFRESERRTVARADFFEWLPFSLVMKQLITLVKRIGRSAK